MSEHGLIHCSEASILITALVDGELDMEEMDRIQSHLDMCEDCTARRRMESRLKSFLGKRLAQVETPAGLAQRVRGALGNLEAAPDGEVMPPGSTPPDATPSGRKKGNGAMRLPLVILVFVLATMMGTQLVMKTGNGRGGGVGSELAIEVGAMHTAANQAGVFQITSRDPEKLGDWFTERMGEAVTIPDLTSLGVVPVGGRVVRLGGTRMVLVLYKDPAEPPQIPPVTLVQGSQAPAMDGFTGEAVDVAGTPVRTDAMGPLKMAAFSHRDRTWMLATERSSEELLQVVRRLLGS